MCIQKNIYTFCLKEAAFKKEASGDAKHVSFLTWPNGNNISLKVQGGFMIIKKVNDQIWTQLVWVGAYITCRMHLLERGTVAPGNQWFIYPCHDGSSRTVCIEQLSFDWMIQIMQMRVFG